jgi:GNAT superfamily N-acetyltransferase
VLSQSGVAITGAYVLPEFRGKGVAEALLDTLLAWAKAQGKTTCSVDFESSNGYAAGFWLRYFKPVCYSLLRRVDPRTVV